MGYTIKINVQTKVKAPVSKIWAAYTTPQAIVQWNTAYEGLLTTKAAVGLPVGGAFSSRMEARHSSFGFDFAGTYTQVVPNALLEYAFGDRTGIVEFVQGSEGVTVRVTFDAETGHPIEQQRQG